MKKAVFGKIMENLRNRVNIELVYGDEIDKQLPSVADPGYISHRIFNKDLIGIHRVKTKLTQNRPIYVGTCVLGLSKLSLYDFGYNHLKNNAVTRLGCFKPILTA